MSILNNSESRSDENIERPRIITGFGRSGTTWVQDAVAEANSLRTIFEPLNSSIIDEAKLFSKRYRTSEDDDPALYEFMRHYFVDDFHSFWVDYRIIGRLFVHPARELATVRGIRKRLSYLIECKRNYLRYRKQRRNRIRITKFVRANLMLAWLKVQFDARIVHIIRHPVPVILSQMSSLRSWRPHRALEEYRKDPRLIDALNPNMRRLLFEPLGDAGGRALEWCIENSIAIQQAEEHDIPVIFYEDIVRSGEREWQRIISALELTIMPSNNLILRPSQQTTGEKAADAKLLLNYASWQERASAEMLDEIQFVLESARFNIYNVHQALPS